MNFIPLEVDHQTYDLEDYDSVKSLLTLKLVNTERNKDLIRKGPSLTKHDMSLIPFLNCGMTDNLLKTITVTDQLLEKWHVPQEQLFDDILRLMPHKEPPLFRTLCADMKGFNGHHVDVPDEICEDYEIQSSFILTKNTRAYGAVCFFYPGMMNRIRELIGPYYVIPSSVHEMILLKDEPFYTADDLASMLHQVNQTVLEENEFLSDHIYYYGKDNLLLQTVA